MPTKKTPASIEEQLAAVQEAHPDADAFAVDNDGVVTVMEVKTRASDLDRAQATKPARVRRKRVADTSLADIVPESVGALSLYDWDKLKALGGVATTQTSWEDPRLEAARKDFANFSAYRALVRQVHHEQVQGKRRPVKELSA